MRWRPTTLIKAFVAGCYECPGDDPRWDGPNAQAVAARHHDLTGHQTWAIVTLEYTYGDSRSQERMKLMEEAHEQKTSNLPGK